MYLFILLSEFELSEPVSPTFPFIPASTTWSLQILLTMSDFEMGSRPPVTLFRNVMALITAPTPSTVLILVNPVDKMFPE